MSHFNWVMAHAETSHVTHEWVMSHARAHFTCKLCHTLEPVISQINKFFSHEHRFTCTGRRRCIGCLRLQVSFRKRATNYRALLQKTTYKDKASYGASPPCRSCHTYSMKKSCHTRKWAVSHLHVCNETCLIYMSHLQVTFTGLTCLIYENETREHVSWLPFTHAFTHILQVRDI